MLCLKKIEVGNTLRPCGQCMNCRINNKRNWTARILLESFFHLNSIFVTLTYEDEHVPLDEDGQQTLKPEDLRKWIKAFRHAYSGEHGAIRFFACGEYGEKTWRPHYHIILFGANLLAESYIINTWKKGFIQIGELNSARAAYVAAYTTKKMTKPGDSRLGNRHPEFARMSMKNGIGFPAVGYLADTMSSKSGMAAMSRYGDVWNSVRIDGKIWPLSNYLRRKLRDALGLSQCPRERAIQLDRIDYSTGEILVNEPLPEDYGPWKDMTEYRFPRTIKYEKDNYQKKDLIFATKRANKDARQLRAAIKVDTI